MSVYQPLSEGALAHARRGSRVFPCRPADDPNKPKAPYIAGGHTAASSDPETVRGMFTGKPDALIGLVPSSVDLVALDMRGGVAFTDLPAEWQETLIVQTQSSGLHVYFRARPEVEYGNGTRPDLGELVDVIRHDRGYVIVPPSKGYRYLTRVKPLPAPDTLATAESSSAIASSSALLGSTIATYPGG